MAEAVSEDEYAVFTAVCKTSLFLFANNGTTFADYTGTAPHFRGFEDKWSAPFTGKAKYLCVQHPEILADFARKNAECVRLERHFEVENGYQWLSERAPEDKNRYFILSRVGFSATGKLGLVYIEYVASCGYYLLFERAGLQWREIHHQLAWVS